MVQNTPADENAQGSMSMRPPHGSRLSDSLSDPRVLLTPILLHHPFIHLYYNMYFIFNLTC